MSDPVEAGEGSPAGIPFPLAVQKVLENFWDEMYNCIKRSDNMEKGKGYYAGEERSRTHVTYQWRCTVEEKEKLMMLSAMERRTANKILSEALDLYVETIAKSENQP